MDLSENPRVRVSTIKVTYPERTRLLAEAVFFSGAVQPNLDEDAHVHSAFVLSAPTERK